MVLGVRRLWRVGWVRDVVLGDVQGGENGDVGFGLSARCAVFRGCRRGRLLQFGAELNDSPRKSRLSSRRGASWLVDQYACTITREDRSRHLLF